MRGLVSVLLLGLICLFAILREFHAETGLAPLAGAALLIWAALEWRGMAAVARLTLGATAGLAGVMAWTGDLTPEALNDAIGRGAFFVLFLVSMDMLRMAAMSSRMVLESGRILVNQPPGRRYAVITVGGHLFAILLNLGAMTLLGTMNRRSIETGRDDATPAQKQIRLRRMTLALVRGFTAFTFWSPTSITVLVVLSANPGLTWAQYAPVGFGAAVVYLAVGWGLDRISYPRRQVAGVQSLGHVLRGLAPMSVLTLLILACGATVSAVLGLRLLASLFLSVPVIGLAWITVQYRRAGWRRALRLTGRRVGRQMLPGLVSLRSEIGIMSAAACIAALLPRLIDVEMLAGAIAGLGLTEAWLLVCLIWFVPLMSPLGLYPIISVAIGVGILGRLPGFEFNPYLLALSGVIAWGLSTGLSPLGATIRIAGRTIDRRPAEIGLVWNRPFTLTILLIASALLLVLT